MDRAEWLKKMRAQSEALYDHIAPAYWITFGFYPNEAHREFIGKFLARLEKLTGRSLTERDPPSKEADR